MGFLGIYSALYDYAAQGEDELTIKQGDTLFLIQDSTEDDWCKAKKRAAAGDDEEPTGLVPRNYIEEARPIHQAQALYDYDRQTDEELSFTADSSFKVYDTSDEDWILVGQQNEFGFVPANYIEILDGGVSHDEDIGKSSTANDVPESPIRREAVPETPSSASSVINTPAAALAGILANKQTSGSSRHDREPSPPPPTSTTKVPSRPILTPEASDEEPPALPTRPNSQQHRPPPQEAATPRSPPIGVMASPPHNRISHRMGEDDDDEYHPPKAGGFHLYNVNEIVAVLGKQKKMPTTLGLNSATGKIMIAPAKSNDGSQQEWTAEKLVHYSLEGKHVFMELVKPAKSVDFHAGAKDTAQEIVSALGEIAGAARAEGLREVIAAGESKKSKIGLVAFKFEGEASDEVSGDVGDEVIILDDSNEGWWMVRRKKDGKQGVMPSAFISPIEQSALSPTTPTGLGSAKSTVEQNRLEEERLAKEASRSSRARERARSNSNGLEVGPGVKLPKRGSSLMARDNDNGSSSQRKREGKTDGESSTAKPRPNKIRTWTDRSGRFKVEAEFIGCKDGKIHLHKTNGVKIAVPVVKMSVEDLEYVENATGLSLDEDKPLSDIRRQKSRSTAQKSSRADTSRSKNGATIEPKKDEYDWFDFFLSCGVAVHECERYSRNFSRDSMDESILPDITAVNLRTLGLKEGDILRVMKHLDNKYSRNKNGRSKRNVSFGAAEVIGSEEGEENTTGGLFSGPGGALRNNTKKGRPAPAVQAGDTVDAKAFDQSTKPRNEPDGAETALTKAPPPIEKDPVRAFDDDAWNVKPSVQPKLPATSKSSSTPAAQPEKQQSTSPPPTGALADLSLLSAPLQPAIAHTTGSQTNPAISSSVSSQPQSTQSQQLPQGATPSFFSQLGQPSGNIQTQPGAGLQMLSQPTSNGPQPNVSAQPTGTQYPSVNLVPQSTGFNLQQPSRQRPQPPPMMSAQGNLMPPPPPRPLSAPQNATQPGQFGPPPLQPQLTGYQNPSQFQSQPQTQIAPPGQSLGELNQMRLQQQLQPQMTGYGQGPAMMQSQPTGYGQPNALPAQAGFNQQGNFANFSQPQQTQQQPVQPQFNGAQGVSSPFGNPGQPGPFQSLAPQQTGYQLQPQGTGINSVLPPALMPQPTGQNGYGSGYNQQNLPPVPPIPQQPTAAPLVPQKTGPPPPVRFGVSGDAKRLVPQATGRRANLSQATPENPFGF